MIDNGHDCHLLSMKCYFLPVFVHILQSLKAANFCHSMLVICPSYCKNQYLTWICDCCWLSSNYIGHVVHTHTHTHTHTPLSPREGVKTSKEYCKLTVLCCWKDNHSCCGACIMDSWWVQGLQKELGIQHLQS